MLSLATPRPPPDTHILEALLQVHKLKVEISESSIDQLGLRKYYGYMRGKALSWKDGTCFNAKEKKKEKKKCFVIQASHHQSIPGRTYWRTLKTC